LPGYFPLFLGDKDNSHGNGTCSSTPNDGRLRPGLRRAAPSAGPAGRRL